MNVAFIDGQNLRLGTKKAKQPWDIDLKRFYYYLHRKYKVEDALYFIGYFDNSNSELYRSITNCGYQLVFREHSNKTKSRKKGNVDTDIVFEAMKQYADNQLKGKVIIVSGDGDYFKMVNYLIQKDRFEKLLAPEERRMSTLYKTLDPKYYAFLNRKDIKKKIGRKNAGLA